MNRKEQLMPNGIPRYVRCYDNGGTEQETIDRFTVVFTGRYAGRPRGWVQYMSMNTAPFAPQGFCQHGEHNQQIDVDKWGFPPSVGKRGKLGKRIAFETLPADCQQAVIQDYVEIWNLESKATA